MITFEIEPEPTDEGVEPTQWGVWEKDPEDPDNDEIVYMADSPALCQEWIDLLTGDPERFENYKKLQGIEP